MRGPAKDAPMSGNAAAELTSIVDPATRTESAILAV